MNAPFRPSIAVVSHPRPPPNAETLREQALAADPRTSECEWKVSEDSAPGPPSAERAAANYARALHMRASTAPGSFHLVVEDDAEMARGWVGQLEEAARLSRGRAGSDRFVLLGYSHLAVEEMLGTFAMSDTGQVKPTPIYRYPENSALWGTVCILYPGALCDEIAQALSARPELSPTSPGRGSLAEYHAAYDEAIGAYCRTHRRPIPIYVIVPNVAQHLGDVSLIHRTQRVRRSPTYVG